MDPMGILYISRLRSLPFFFVFGIQELIMDQIKPRLEKLAKKQMPGLCTLETLIPMDMMLCAWGIL